MMKIKRTAQIILAPAVLLFCLSACGGQGKGIPANDVLANDMSASNISANDSISDAVAPSEEEPKAVAEESKETEESAKMSETDITNGSADEASRVLVAYFSVTGNTKKLAKYAAEVMGADLYEIVPEEPYTEADIDWHDDNSRTSIEMNDDSVRPAIDGGVADMDQYDIVFIGYPIWWGDAPRIMDTFMESYDFSRKTIVPFCTSGSSGIGISAEELHAYTDDSVTWLDGNRFPGSSSKEDVADWIRGLSLGIEVK